MNHPKVIKPNELYHTMCKYDLISSQFITSVLSLIIIFNKRQDLHVISKSVSIVSLLFRRYISIYLETFMLNFLTDSKKKSSI